MRDNFLVATDKLAFKKKVHEHAIAEVKKQADDLQKQIIRTQDGGIIIDEDQLDVDQQAQYEAAHEVVNELSNQLNFELEQVQILERMNVGFPLLDAVAPGAVVVTNRRTFFVSVGIEELVVANRKIYGLSPKAPIYAVMEGKTKGETFKFRDTEYLIEDVF